MKDDTKLICINCGAQTTVKEAKDDCNGLTCPNCHKEYLTSL